MQVEFLLVQVSERLEGQVSLPGPVGLPRT